MNNIIQSRFNYRIKLIPYSLISHISQWPLLGIMPPITWRNICILPHIWNHIENHIQSSYLWWKALLCGSIGPLMVCLFIVALCSLYQNPKSRLAKSVIYFSFFCWLLFKSFAGLRKKVSSTKTTVELLFIINLKTIARSNPFTSEQDHQCLGKIDRRSFCAGSPHISPNICSELWHP